MLISWDPATFVYGVGKPGNAVRLFWECRSLFWECETESMQTPPYDCDWWGVWMVSDFYFHAITVLCLLLPWLLLRVFEVCSSEEGKNSCNCGLFQQEEKGRGEFYFIHSSGAVWELRWPSWAVCPNEPSVFHGCKYLLTMLRHLSQLTSEDIKHHFIIYFIPFFFWGVTYWKQKQCTCMHVCARAHTHTHTHTHMLT